MFLNVTAPMIFLKIFIVSEYRGSVSCTNTVTLSCATCLFAENHTWTLRGFIATASLHDYVVPRRERGTDVKFVFNAIHNNEEMRRDGMWWECLVSHVCCCSDCGEIDCFSGSRRVCQTSHDTHNASISTCWRGLTNATLLANQHQAGFVSVDLIWLPLCHHNNY